MVPHAGKERNFQGGKKKSPAEKGNVRKGETPGGDVGEGCEKKLRRGENGKKSEEKMHIHENVDRDTRERQPIREKEKNTTWKGKAGGKHDEKGDFFEGRRRKK